MTFYMLSSIFIVKLTYLCSGISISLDAANSHHTVSLICLVMYRVWTRNTKLRWSLWNRRRCDWRFPKRFTGWKSSLCLSAHILNLMNFLIRIVLQKLYLLWRSGLLACLFLIHRLKCLVWIWFFGNTWNLIVALDFSRERRWCSHSFILLRRTWLLWLSSYK